MTELGVVEEQSGANRIGRFAPHAELTKVASSFLRNGAVVFDGLWSADRIGECRARLARSHPELFDETLINCKRVLKVSGHRYVVPIILTTETAFLDLLLQEDIMNCFSALLGSGWVIEAIGGIVSFPGASLQKLHRDGSALYGEKGLDRILPPYAITLAIPLLPMDNVRGSTGLLPGSQINFDEDPDETVIAPEVPIGSCIFWNYLLLHQGMPNRSDAPRPLLYVTACRPFWIDERNFMPHQRGYKLMVDREVLEALDEEQRARFYRAGPPC